MVTLTEDQNSRSSWEMLVMSFQNARGRRGFWILRRFCFGFRSSFSGFGSFDCDLLRSCSWPWSLLWLKL